MTRRDQGRRGVRAGFALAAAAAIAAAWPVPAGAQPEPVAARAAAPSSETATPIKHLVVIFQENVSFDHYFATYPNAANVAGETLQARGVAAPTFTAAPDTPATIDTLAGANLLAPNNPNSVQPFRLTPTQAVTCSQDHGYTAEQEAFNGGAMDKFVEHTSNDWCFGRYGTKGLAMGYYDGNTVTALWNYAQHYAMSDAFFSTTFGPSTPGAINLISGQTHGVRSYDPKTRERTSSPDGRGVKFPNADGVGTVTTDPDPAWDDCSSTRHAVAGLDGKNIGDLLNAKGVTWGWFQGGFRPTKPATDTSRAECGARHTNVGGVSSKDYSPHHQPFQYYRSTANPKHLPPSSTPMIGRTDQANHQYDLADFAAVVDTPYLPAVSFLKAPAYQDGHASYSSPLDEQTFLVETINAIQESRNWADTAIVVAYDDSDGWYDHAMATITNASDTSDDAAICTDAAARGVPISGGYVARCGPGTRMPLLVISPYARANYVDHEQTDQASILRFIEDNWRTGRIGDASADARAGSLTGLFDFRGAKRDRLYLDPIAGTVTDSPPERCGVQAGCVPDLQGRTVWDWMQDTAMLRQSCRVWPDRPACASLKQ